MQSPGAEANSAARLHSSLTGLVPAKKSKSQTDSAVAEGPRDAPCHFKTIIIIIIIIIII